MQLWDSLNLQPTRHRVVTLVGGGGKTTLMYALAREVRAAGGAVIVTTTTHILPHPRLFLTQETRREPLRALLDTHGILCLGQRSQEGKLQGAGGLDVCQTVAHAVLVEGDGAKFLPLKAPADHEPVIPPESGAVAAVAGMDCLGRPIQAVCHRPERVCALLGKPPEALVEPEDVVQILSSPQGGRKSVGPHMAFRCVLNKAELAPHAAESIRSQLARLGIHTAITSFQEKERGGLCWF